MQLSKSFAIDKDEPWVARHNKEAAEVLDAYERDKPVRVPLFPGGGIGFYMDENNLDCRVYYNNPDEMLRIQLEVAKRQRELPWYDFVLGGAPESWGVSVDFWPVVAPGAFGCELLCRPNAVIAHHSLALGIESCRVLPMPDVFTGGILAKSYEYYHYLKNTYEGKLDFLGAPVGKTGHGVATNGLFSLALDLRGPEIMADMYEEPEFAASFFERLATWIDGLEKAWDDMSGSPYARPVSPSDHGIDMLSAGMYEEFLVPIVKRHNAIRGTEAGTAFHHCGSGVHLFETVRKHFGITSIGALTYPDVDIERVRGLMGDEVWLCCCINGGVLSFGTEQQIIDAVKGVMKAKGRGRLSMMVGDLIWGTPAKNYEVLYEAVKAYGKY